MTATWSPSPPAAPPVEGDTTPPGAPAGDQFSRPFGAPTPPPPPPSSPPAPPRRKGGGWRAGAAVLAAVGLLGLGFGARAAIDDHTSTNAAAPAADVTPTVSAPSATSDGSTEAPVVASGDEPVAAVAAALSPAVVQVQTDQGLGSGVVYDASAGLVLTNAHVVGSSSTVSVALEDGTRYDGKVLGADTSTDIAVVQVSGAQGLTAARLATVAPQVGQMAVALGSPFGFEGTVTSGIVSAVNRPVDNEANVAVNMIQTDAPINPGNSGGALANRRGEVIGINSSIYSQSGESNGIGFAIPIETAKSVADKIVNGGSLDKAGLGLQGSDDPNGQPGAYVRAVSAGSPAEQAGVRQGDLVVSVEGQRVKSMEELRGRIGTYNPGDTITLRVQRDGSEVDLHVTLGSLQALGGTTSPITGGSGSQGQSGGR